MTFTDEQWIELTGGVGLRADGFRFDVLNPDRSYQGTLDVSATQPPTIDADTSRDTKRTLSGLTVYTPPSDLNPRASRVQPVLTLPNGSEYQLGVFAFGTDNKNRYTFGDIWTPELFDESFLFNDGLARTVTLDVGDSILGLFRTIAGEVLDPLGIPTSYTVDDVAAAAPVVWVVGTKQRKDVLADCATLLGALPHYFANDGTHTLRTPPAAGAPPEHVYESGGRIINGTVQLTDSSYKAYNRYIVTGEQSASPIRGLYDLPPSAPHSYAQNGNVYVTAPIHRVAGLASVTLANLIAYVDALKDKNTYRTATFSAACDPRHDLFQTGQLLGESYLERGYRLQCGSGGNHDHTWTGTWV